MNITLLSGTNRPGSHTRHIADDLAKCYRDLDQQVTMLDLHDLPLEAFSPEAYAQKPASLTPFIAAVLESDGLHVVTPEYNGAAPGVLKYFIDLLPFPESFERRPVAFTGLAAGRWGALRAVEHIQGVFGYRNAHVYPERVFLPEIGEHISATGELTNPEWRERLRRQAEGFVDFVERLRGAGVTLTR